MAVTSCYFGSFDMNNNAGGYYVTSRTNSSVMKQQTITPFARMEGGKKNGEQIGPRTIPITVHVLGSSRADLENKLDALYQALDLPQQALTLHQNDGRYFIADAIYEEAPLGIGNAIAAEVKITFVCQQPYAFALNSSTFNSGTLTFTLSGGSYVSPTIFVTGGGNKFSRPKFIVKNRSTNFWTSMTVQQLTDNQSLNVTNAHLVRSNGDTITIQNDPTIGFSVIDTEQGLLVPNGSFLTLNPGATPYLITVQSGSAVSASVTVNWTSRWIS